MVKTVPVEDGKQGKRDHQNEVFEAESEHEHGDKLRQSAAERRREQHPHDLASEFCFRLAFLILRFYEAEAVKIHRQDIDGDEHIEKNSPAHSLNMCG